MKTLLSANTVCVALLVIAGVVVADDTNSIKLLEKYSSNEIESLFREHTTISSSEINIRELPPHSLYGAILAKILYEGFRPNEFSESDWQRALAFPSHSNEIFVRPSRDETTIVCDSIDHGQNSGLLDSASVHSYENAFKVGDKILDAHYEGFYNSLSHSARSLIDKEIESLAGTRAIVHSSMSLSRLYDDAPALVDELIKVNCMNLLSGRFPEVEDTLTLKESIARNTEIMSLIKE